VRPLVASTFGVPLPFEGQSGWVAAALTIGFAVVVLVFVWTIVLALLAERWSHQIGERDRAIERDGLPPLGSESDWSWVFLVPALDEERTIADSIARLRGVAATSRIIVAIDDGSTDATPEILRGLAGGDLEVIRRDAPEARQGKSRALDQAWRELPVLFERRGMDRERTVVCVVDADGRLEPHAPARVALQLAEEGVGGVQVLVRIYNRRHLLTWMQDLEFRIMGLLFQSARSRMGTAGMGGNGQFVRLSALDDVADSTGPWRDALTEDQDLGLRLLAGGWRLVHDNGTHVEQQGVPGLRALYRQRTRWAQGNIQAISLLPRVLRADSLGIPARTEQVAALLMPVWQLIVGSAFVVALWLLAIGEVTLFGDGQVSTIVFYYLLGFSGTMVGCMTQGWRLYGASGLLVGLLVVNVYALYSWLLWPVLIRALARQLLRRRSWAKTPRELVDPDEPLVDTPVVQG
jgi:cellulose synthase/poly-beta-1,6-N-acetylglucosamine synthase-like glycosyltransferase